MTREHLISDEMELTHDLVEFVRLTERPKEGLGFKVSSPWFCVHDNLTKLENEIGPFLNYWKDTFDEFVTALVRNEWLVNRHPVPMPDRVAWSLSGPDHPIRARSAAFVDDPVPLRHEMISMPPIAPYENIISEEGERWIIAEKWKAASIEIAFWSDHVPQKIPVRVFFEETLGTVTAAYGDRLRLSAFLFMPKQSDGEMNHTVSHRPFHP